MSARVAQLLPIVLIVVVVNFLLIRLAPGDPTAYLIGDAPVSEEFVVFGQPRQEDLLAFLEERLDEDAAGRLGLDARICLEPPSPA